MFLRLVRIKVSVPVAFTTFTAFVLSHGRLDAGFILPTLGIFLLACGSSALNQVQEAETDSRMPRTSGRPIPSGDIKRSYAFGISMLLILIGSVLLIAGPGWKVLGIGLAAVAWYNGIYTPLKRITAFAILPGAIVGVLPPLAGWIAGGGSLLHPSAWILSGFFFIGQIPHFWLLTLQYGAQYEKAGLPSISSYFSKAQIRRMTFTWIFCTGIAAMILPFTGLAAHFWSSAALYLVSTGIILLFVPLLRPGQPIKQGRPFRLINSYYLLVMAILILDRLSL